MANELERPNPSIAFTADHVLKYIRDRQLPSGAVEEIEIPTRQGKRKIPYLPWPRVAQALDGYTGGHWTTAIIKVDSNAEHEVKKDSKGQKLGDGPWPIGRARVTVALSIHCKDATITRTSIGEYRYDKVQSSFNDATLMAERKAFKRAAAQFGIGDDLEDERED